jgi:tRNA G18 (ribose-2'-O)-methylase SpoU
MLIPIPTIDDPRLDHYRDLKRSSLIRSSGLFIAEGWRVVRRLLRSDFAVHSVLLSQRRAAEFQDELPESVPVYVLPDHQAAELIGYNFHSGALACGYRRSDVDLDAILHRAAARSLLVVCTDVQDAENLGSIVRLSAAFGAEALLTGERCADPFSRRALRVSMANALSLPVLTCRNLVSQLRRLRDEFDFELVATVLDGQAESLEQARGADRLALLFGNEAHGLGPQWVELCSRSITIPMERGTDSLNVSTAAAVFLYHFRRVMAHTPSTESDMGR